MLPHLAWKVLEQAELFCDSESVQKTIKPMAGEISAVLRESNPVVLAIAGRGENRSRVDMDGLNDIHHKGMARVGRVIETLLGGAK